MQYVCVMFHRNFKWRSFYFPGILKYARSEQSGSSPVIGALRTPWLKSRRLWSRWQPLTPTWARQPRLTAGPSPSAPAGPLHNLTNASTIVTSQKLSLRDPRLGTYSLCKYATEAQLLMLMLILITLVRLPSLHSGNTVPLDRIYN